MRFISIYMEDKRHIWDRGFNWEKIYAGTGYDVIVIAYNR